MTLSSISIAALVAFSFTPALLQITEDAPIELTAPAQQVSGPVPEAEQPELLEKAATALEAARTARGRFIQTNADASVLQGSFALSRPGRMRFEYDDPTPILIVADGATVAIEDSELETVDRLPLGATPLGLILDSRLNFETEAEVTGMFRSQQSLQIGMRDRSGETEGQLVLVLDPESYDLLGWRAADEAGGVTTVDLLDVEQNIRLRSRLFELEDPEDIEDDERR